MESKLDAQFFYGGQAVMEGILMRGKKAFAMAVRTPKGDIKVIDRPLPTLTRRFPFLRLPLLRGSVELVLSMKLAYSALSQSAEIAMDGLEEEGEPGRIERFLVNKFGDRLNKIILGVFMVLSLVLALGLLMLLPTFFASLVGAPGALTGVLEGVIRMLIFISYLAIVSRTKDIQRVFMYHGAEHKAINCHEQNLPLTSENVAASNRLHKRCGTSFMLVVMVVAMVMFMVIRIEYIWLRFASRIILLPVIAGIAYEISVKWAGKRDNRLVRAIITPGMLMQRLTTKEPDEGQIEIAITALNTVLAQEQATP
ncbi:MAG: DUF1385 domain-containing protein [Defluviitaleaceae bacterium]|nr:DUF1385 domain-containing protein [Defluviitaleaceae bacterium]